MREKADWEKQRVYERKTHETKVAEFNLRGARQTRSYPGSPFMGQTKLNMYGFHPSSKKNS